MKLHRDRLPGGYFGSPNLVSLLRRRVALQADEAAFVFLSDGESAEIAWTYEQLDRHARAIAAHLVERNMAGERILLLFPAGLDFIAAFFGCLYAGATAVPAYPPRRNRNAQRIESIVDDCLPAAALCTQGVYDQTKDLIAETPCLDRLDWCCVDTLNLGEADGWTAPSDDPDALAFLQYTSGSTGDPKGVMLTHRNLMHNSAMISYAFEQNECGIGVFWLPMYHDMGLIGGLLQPMYVGQPNILMSPMSFLQRPLRWLKAVSRYRACISGGPNFAYDLCVDKIADKHLDKLDLSCWELAFNGAEPVQSDTLDRFADKFERCGFRREAFYPCYGLAESTLIVTGGRRAIAPTVKCFDATALEKRQAIEASPSDVAARDMVGSGSALLDERLAIVDPKTCRRLPDGAVGEIWASSGSVATGYWNQPELSAATFHAEIDGEPDVPYLRTGDLGFLVDGELFVAGRLKDLIIVRGVNYYPQDLERTVEEAHSRIRFAGAAAASTVIDGTERIVLFAETQRRGDETHEEIAQSVRAALAREHELAVDGVVLVPPGGLPKTSSGKIRRQACKQQWQAGDLDVLHFLQAWRDDGGAELRLAEVEQETPDAEPRPAAAHGRTADIVLACLRKVAKGRAKNLQLGDSIVEIGLDSLERMEIVASIEDAFGARFPEHVLTEMETPAEVIDAVETYLLKNRTVEPEGRRRYEITPELYDPASFPEVRQLAGMRQLLHDAGLQNPYFTAHEQVVRDTTVVDGKEYVCFATYNYLGLAGDPTVMQASKDAIDRYGTSCSASRLVAGERTIHRELEQTITDFLGVEAAMALGSGHSTNESVLGHLAGPGDLLLHDELAHNSITQGAKLSGARRRPFPHNDAEAVDRILTEQRDRYRRVYIAIEGVYSMDGDIAPVPDFIEVKNRHKALLYIDEAHSIGVLGLHGRGVSEHFSFDPRQVDVWMGTLSKGLGAIGGYIGGTDVLIEYLKYTTPSFVFSGALNPCEAAAAKASLQLLEDEPDRVGRLAENAKRFLSRARAYGLNTGMSRGTPIVPVILGNSVNALRASAGLKERGFIVPPIMHPAVEEAAARLRFFITSVHTDSQIDGAVDALAEVLREIDPKYVKDEPTFRSRETASGR